MSTCYIMRHGRTVLDDLRRSDGWIDMPLSDEGRLGIIKTEQLLKSVPIHTIYVADLKRVVETAEIIESGLASKPPIVEDARLRTWNLGIIAGMRKRYGRPEVEQLIKSPDTAPEGGESFNSFYDRFWTFFRPLIDNSSDDAPILFIGSGSALRLIGQMLFGDPEKLDLDEGGLSVITGSGTKWTCKTILQSAHPKDNRPKTLS
jgi:broad specificity phosphatase PhoE